MTEETATPADPAYQRRWSVRRVAHALTIGKRDEDKTIRKTAAVTGGSASIITLAMFAINAYQAEAKAWREVSVKQTEITAKAVDRSTEAMGGLRDAVLAQTETFRSLNFTLNRIEDKATAKAKPIAPARLEAHPVKR